MIANKFSLTKGFVCFLVFYLTTIFSLTYNFRANLINLICAIFLVLSFNPFGIDKEKKIYFSVIGVLFSIVGYFLSNMAVWIIFVAFLSSIYVCLPKKDEYLLGKMIILVASFLNLAIITHTKIGDIQYDFASCYNYIEYIMENNFLFWRENPLLTRPSYSTYHPILHFFMSAVVLKSGILLGATKEIASEALQVMYVCYMFSYYLVGEKIFKLLNFRGIIYIGSISFLSLFPVYNAIGGFFNNDGLTVLLQSLVIYYSLLYYKEGGFSNIIKVSLIAILCCLTKLSGVLVLSGLLIALLARLYIKQDKQTFMETLLCGCLVLCGMIIWPMYQYFVLGIGFDFVPPQEHLSIAKFSLIERFSPIKAIFYNEIFYQDLEINLWETLSKTALFGQWNLYARAKDIMWLLWSIVYLYKFVLIMIFIGSFYILIKNYNKFITYFILALIVSILSGMIVFVIKHPYSCSQDFRYIAISVLVMSMILGKFLENMPKWIKNIGIGGVICFSVLSSIVWWYAVFS